MGAHAYHHHPATREGGSDVREASTEEEAVARDGFGVVPTQFAIHGPKTVPRIDYERIFVLDTDAHPLGEYALHDDCPLEFEDLRGAIPVNGMRHLTSFYQGEYAFTPFRVENLWFVVLTRGVPRIEERGSIGTLLAAMRVHLPPSLAPALAEHEETLRERERELEAREFTLTRREQRVTHLEAELQVSSTKMKEREADIRARENRLTALRDYAMRMQTAFRKRTSKPKAPGEPEETPPPGEMPVPRNP